MARRHSALGETGATVGGAGGRGGRRQLYLQIQRVRAAKQAGRQRGVTLAGIAKLDVKQAIGDRDAVVGRPVNPVGLPGTIDLGRYAVVRATTRKLPDTKLNIIGAIT